MSWFFCASFPTSECFQQWGWGVASRKVKGAGPRSHGVTPSSKSQPDPPHGTGPAYAQESTVHKSRSKVQGQNTAQHIFPSSQGFWDASTWRRECLGVPLSGALHGVLREPRHPHSGRDSSLSHGSLPPSITRWLQPKRKLASNPGPSQMSHCQVGLEAVTALARSSAAFQQVGSPITSAGKTSCTYPTGRDYPRLW